MKTHEAQISFYAAPDRAAALQREAASWLGTPFFDGIGRRAKKGACCDCVSWAAAALQSTGGIGAVPWPDRYVSYTGGPEMLDVLIGTLAKVPGLKRIDDREWKIEPNAERHPQSSILNPQILTIGDLLIGSTGRANHHLALFTGDNHIVHCWQGRVIESNVHDTVLLRHLHSIWRPYGV